MFKVLKAVLKEIRRSFIVHYLGKKVVGRPRKI